MKVLGIINRDSAVAYHRITLPLCLMADTDVHITNHITEETFTQGYDIVFYSRLLSDFAFDKLNEMRAHHGFKIVCDVDDYWTLDKWHCMYKAYVAEDFHARQIKNMISADAVFVTHERLYKEAQEFNDNVYIVANSIPRIEQFADTGKIESDKIRLFWQGGISHEEDINLLKYAIQNIANTERAKIEMVLAGFHPEEEIWFRIANTYTCNRRLKNRIIEGLHYESYYLAYAYADVCLVPLVNSKFNGMKSNLKILEAGNMSLPCIAHNVDPYKDMPVYYARGTMDWVKAMKYYINNENARIEDGQRLNEYCNTFFNYKAINEARKEIFSDIKVTA